MKILLSCNHQYPSYQEYGSGRSVTAFPSGSSHHQHDLLARGLAEKGHSVFYHVNHTDTTVADAGVQLVKTLRSDVDIVHLNARIDTKFYEYYKIKGIPVIATNHLYKPKEVPPFRWVHVSKTMAELYGTKDYVWCGLDPEHYVYREQKEDYVLFMANMTRYSEKGLDTALQLISKMPYKLIVAGSSQSAEVIEKVQALCEAYGATYIGDIRGRQKALLLANATALFSPSKLSETFGITLIEALFSGTPVVCSNNGAYPEIISKDVGFICETISNYIEAFQRIKYIKPSTCRSYALKHFHYRNTTEKYLEIYKDVLKGEQQKLMMPLQTL